MLLNLSRDQLDRVGEINPSNERCAAGLARHPKAVVVANCDDVLMTSAAYDSPNVVWVAAGGGWAERLGELSRAAARSSSARRATGTRTGTDFKRPSPALVVRRRHRSTGPTGWRCR